MAVRFWCSVNEVEKAMSLLSEAMEPFRYIDKTTQDDGYGGVETVWHPGAGFDAASVLNNSMEARRAAKEGVTSLYTITTSKSVTLMHGDIIRRESDGQLFRVTSNGTDAKTPPSAVLDMRSVTAEALDSLPQS